MCSLFLSFRCQEVMREVEAPFSTKIYVETYGPLQLNSFIQNPTSHTTSITQKKASCWL